MLARKRLNFGIVGVGYFGPNYARILNEIEGVGLTWCSDMDKKALLKMKNLYSSISTTQNYKEMLADKKLDCVIIVTPAKTHFEIAKDVLLSGKNILIEKPLCSTLSEAQKLTKLVSKSGRVFAIDHLFKFNPGIIKLRQLIKDGELGKIYYLYGLYNALGPIRKDVSAMWDLSPHFIYTANFILDKMPLVVSAMGSSFLLPKMEDVVFMNLEYENNILFNLHSSWLDPVKVRQLVVVGSKKMALFDDLAFDGKLKIYEKSVTTRSDPNFADLRIILRTGDTLIPKLENKEPLKDVVLDFINSVRTGKQPATPVQEGKNVVKILQALQDSLDHNNQRIKIFHE